MARKKSVQMLPIEWRASTSLAWVYALRMLGMFLVLPVLSLHAKELSGTQSSAMVGLAMGIYGLTQACCQLPLGILSDKLGRKKVIYAGLIIFALGSFICANANEIHTLIIGRAIQGAGAVSAAVTALLADLTREEVRTRAMSMIGLTIGLTFSVSLVLSPMLTKAFGVSGLFAIMGSLTILSIGVVAWFTPSPTQSRLHEDAGTRTEHIGEVIKNTQLLRLNFGIFALQSCLMAIFTSLPFALTKLHLDKTEHWQVYLPATVIGLILMIPAIIIGETRNKLKHVFLLGIFLTFAAEAALIGSLASIWSIGACLVIYFIGFNILEASMPSLVSKIAPPELKGTAMGIYNTMQSIGIFTGGIIGSRLYILYNNQGVLLFCCIVAIIWFIVAATAPAPKPIKNFMFPIPKLYQHDLNTLYIRIKDNVKGIETIRFSQDGQTLFIQALRQEFDEEHLNNILTGVK